ncbi:alpha-(1-_6)-mannopyranosyltransferase A [Corynebacterium diphtheriae]|nr:alpha-(1->6)-mannopyranosyltransferase A [Corynebacterium diphtheriae]
MDFLQKLLRTSSTLSPVGVGIFASILIALGSFGGGAIRNRGGLLESLHVEFLAYGHGAGFSNITLWIGTALYIIAWYLLGRRVMQSAVSLRYVTHCIWLWITPLLFAAPIMSRDVYSYLIQGTLLRDGFDAYTQGAAVNPSPILYEVSHDWRNTTTPYGPLHLWLGEWITTVTGNHISIGVLLFKLVSLVGFGAIVWSIPKIAAAIGGNPTFALWLGVANPVMVFHLIGGMHNEALMVGLVSIGFVFALRRSPAWIFAGIAVIAVGMALKATAAFALPFVVWIAVAQAGPTLRSRIVRFMIFALVGAVETIAIVALITWASGASSGWIAALSGNTKVINPLAFPSLVATLISGVGSLWLDPFPFNAVVAVIRKISLVFMGLGVIGCWWYFRKSERAAIQGTAAGYMVAFFFNAVTLPWYYTSIVSLIGTFTPPVWLQKLTVMASIIVAFAFTGSGNHQLYNPVWMLATTVAAWWMTRSIFNASTTSSHSTAESLQ